MAYTAWSVIAGEVPTTAKWNLLGANDAEFNSKILQILAEQTLNVASDGANVEFDLSITRLWTVTLGGNRNLVVTNVPIGKIFIIRIKQDGNGGRIPTWWDGIIWPSGSPPTLSPDPSRVDTFAFLCTASGQFDGYFVGFGLA